MLLNNLLFKLCVVTFIVDRLNMLPINKIPYLWKIVYEWIGKGMEGSGRVLILIVIQTFALKDGGNPRKFS
jgi:hypothetical protein